MRIFRWLIRIGSLLFLAFHAADIAGDAWPAMLSTADKVNLVVSGIILLGMILAWKSEGLGGFVVITGFIVQAALHPDTLTVWAMWIAPAIGCLFVVYWAMSEGQVSR
jgi:hypothetical protein